MVINAQVDLETRMLAVKKVVQTLSLWSVTKIAVCSGQSYV